MKNAARKLIAGAEMFGAILVGATVFILFASIVSREIGAAPMTWANEVSLALFVWIIFIGAAVAFAKNGRIRFTFIVERLGARASDFLDVVVSWVGIVVLGALFMLSVDLVVDSAGQRFQTLAISTAWQMAGLPVGMLIAMVGWLSEGRFRTGRRSEDN
ncbi:TRAP transporter small permease subunit [uncultured Castellaniella sp.]|uniref:TRAP transporter small permease n=1 Tax=uncultured Castellaniella sp. TaxID=647907 RepID=UPI00260F950B|nr:TRAP transporter small permease subunit [uncultured Castellaniella sp.]